MRKLTLLVGLMVLSVGAQAQAATITFDEIALAQINPGGVVVGGVTFNYTPISGSDPNAYFNSVSGPDQSGDNTQFLDLHTIEGSAWGLLRFDFAAPIGYLQFAAALDTNDSVSPGLWIQLLNSSATTVFSGSLNTFQQSGYVFSEGLFTYAGAPVVTTALLNFDATSGNCASESVVGRCGGGRFAIDNLTYDSAPPPDPVPEPATLSLLALGAAGLRFARRRSA